jgi:hypothetical protein
MTLSRISSSCEGIKFSNWHEEYGMARLLEVPDHLAHRHTGEIDFWVWVYDPSTREVGNLEYTLAPDGCLVPSDFRVASWRRIRPPVAPSITCLFVTSAGKMRSRLVGSGINAMKKPVPMLVRPSGRSASIRVVLYNR